MGTTIAFAERRTSTKLALSVILCLSARSPLARVLTSTLISTRYSWASTLATLMRGSGSRLERAVRRITQSMLDMGLVDEAKQITEFWMTRCLKL